MLDFFFGFHGRIRRSSYFVGVLLASFLWVIVAIAGLAALNIQVDGGLSSTVVDYDPSPLGFVITSLIGIAALWAGLALTVKRWHDVGVTGWFSVLSLPPFANFAMFLLLCLLPGSPGDNRYGASPRNDDLFTVTKSGEASSGAV